MSGILDRQLSSEERDEERLKHLRQATGQITRSANDGIQAYRRVSQALRAEAQHAMARGERGFGYDPVFVPDALGDGRTMAELDDAEKDAVSHLGAAARGLVAALGPDASSGTGRSRIGW